MPQTPSDEIQTVAQLASACCAVAQYTLDEDGRPTEASSHWFTRARDLLEHLFEDGKRTGRSVAGDILSYPR
jgi:hypothetical protein